MKGIIKKMLHIVTLFMLLLIFGCDSSTEENKENNKQSIDMIMSLEDIKESETVIDYFGYKNMEVSGIELEKRQTNKDSKEDIACVDIIAKNDTVSLSGKYVVRMTYYDVGGWQVESILIDGPEIYEVIAIPQFEIEIEKSETNIQDVVETEKNVWTVTYECHYIGKVADIIEIWQRTYKFNENTGKFNVTNNKKISYDIAINELNGIYTADEEYEAYPNKYQLEFADNTAKLIYYSYDQWNREYDVNYLGEKTLCCDDYNNVYYFEFKYYRYIYVCIDQDNVYVSFSQDTRDLKNNCIPLAVIPDMITTVPDCYGKTYEEARDIFEQYELNVEYRFIESNLAEGTVISTIPASGESIEKDTLIIVNISQGEYDTLVVPNTKGRDYDEVKAELENLGFEVQKVENYSDIVEKGKIISQSLRAGKIEPYGATIILVVSRGENH